MKTKNDKCILSLRIARKLMAEGFEMKNIELSKKRKGDLVFVFEYTPELQKAFSDIMTKGA